MVLENLPYFVNLNSYARALIVFFVMFLVLRILLFFIEKILLKITAKTTSDLDDLLLEKSSKPLSFVALLISLLFALNELILTEALEMILYRSIYTLLAISVGYLVFVIVDNSLMRLWKKFAAKTKSNIDDTIGQLVHEVLRIALIFIIAVMILNIWGINIGPLLAGLGIAGLAVALALQPTLSNIFSGIALVIDGTFKVGDVIEIGDKMGEVYKIGLRTTKIKSFDNEMIIIPNSEMANSTLKNFFQPDISIRVNIEFGVEYGVDPEYIKKLVIDELEKIKIIDKEKDIGVLFTEMGDNSLNFKARFWVDNIAKKWPAHQEAITRIYRRLYEEKIGIPYPQRTVWMRDESKVKSPDPKDAKFDSVKGKYYSAMGHEYKEEEVEKEEKGKGGKKKKGFFRRFGFDEG